MVVGESDGAAADVAAVVPAVVAAPAPPQA
jgi:hypothetical protein